MTGTFLPSSCSLDRVHDCSELRNANASDNARRADRARSDPNLDGVGARIDQRLRTFLGCDVAGDDLHGVRQTLDAIDRIQHPRRMTMRGVDNDDIDSRLNEALGALKPALAHCRCRRDAKPSLRILARQWMRDRLFHVLDGDQTDAAILFIDHQQFLRCDDDAEAAWLRPD